MHTVLSVSVWSTTHATLGNAQNQLPQSARSITPSISTISKTEPRRSSVINAGHTIPFALLTLQNGAPWPWSTPSHTLTNPTASWVVVITVHTVFPEASRCSILSFCRLRWAFGNSSWVTSYSKACWTISLNQFVLSHGSSLESGCLPIVNAQSVLQKKSSQTVLWAIWVYGSITI